MAYYAILAFIGGMPAPTKDDSKNYRWWFSSLNLFGANISRATNTRIERSPNFQDALNVQQAIQGQTQTVMVPPPEIPKE